MPGPRPDPLGRKHPHGTEVFVECSCHSHGLLVAPFDWDKDVAPDVSIELWGHPSWSATSSKWRTPWQRIKDAWHLLWHGGWVFADDLHITRDEAHRLRNALSAILQDGAEYGFIGIRGDVLGNLIFWAGKGLDYAPTMGTTPELNGREDVKLAEHLLDMGVLTRRIDAKRIEART